MISTHPYQESLLWTQSRLKTAGKLQQLLGFMLEDWFSPVKAKICVGHGSAADEKWAVRICKLKGFKRCNFSKMLL